MIYDRPVSELMHDAAAELSPPFRVVDVVGWFEAKYPKIKRTTITTHILAMTSNARSRHHYPTLAARPPVFFRSEDGRLERFDPDHHLGEEEAGEAADEGALVEEITSDAAAEFVLESQLEAFLLGNWNVISWGRPLQLWEGLAAAAGHQLATPIGRLDFLCVDTSTNALVVVELKRGRPSDRVVGQVARYMGWVRTHLAAEGQAVEGLIVAHETDDSLRYAVAALPGLRLMTYEVKFELATVEPPAKPVPTV